MTLRLTLLTCRMRSSAVNARAGGGMYREAMTWGDGSEVLGPREDAQECENDSAGDDG